MTRQRYYILDINWRPMPVKDVLVWAEWIERTQIGRLRTTETHFLTVSSIFLGLDHAFRGPPMLFETQIALRDDLLPGECPHDLEKLQADLSCTRFSSWAICNDWHTGILDVIDTEETAAMGVPA